ncbi:MAG: riboflavin synthase [Solirubrobacteraceae bacterium]
MFTGLIADLGELAAVRQTPDGVTLTVFSALTEQIGEGESVSVNGVCLTATAVSDGAFDAEVMNETLHLTSLAQARPGTPVNLELAVRASDRLGGHVVQGHVDGTGTVTAVTPDGFARRVTIDAPQPVLRYLVQKGSVTVDGVSLTIAELEHGSFTVSLIPETLERTNLGAVEVGTIVNLEVDVLAKYVERLLAVPR